jgi:hypothetical protein
MEEREMKRALLLLLMVASVACGADREFDRVVSAIEKHYGVKRTHIPLMGVANFFVKVARPAGTSGFKLAVFEDLPDSGYDDQEALDRLLDEVSHGRLHPLVVTRSRRDNESTYILAAEAGKDTDILIATFERNEATVIEARVSMPTLAQMMAAPSHAHYLIGVKHDRDDDGR